MRILFVCGRNLRRSPTAERLFAGVGGVEAASAGVSPDAEEPVSLELIEWADIVFAMEPAHRRKLQRKFGAALRGRKLVCLGIPDEFDFMDPKLVELLWERVPRSVPGLSGSRPVG